MVKIKTKLNLWYDRQGKPIVTADFETNRQLWLKQMSKCEKLLADRKYKIIKQEYLWWGGWLSTVWLGLDHRFTSDTKPLIFETMLFRSKKHLTDIAVNRYSTEAEALAGHEQIKKEWSSLLGFIKALRYIFLAHRGIFLGLRYELNKLQVVKERQWIKLKRKSTS